MDERIHRADKAAYVIGRSATAATGSDCQRPRAAVYMRVTYHSSLTLRYIFPTHSPLIARTPHLFAPTPLNFTRTTRARARSVLLARS